MDAILILLFWLSLFLGFYVYFLYPCVLFFLRIFLRANHKLQGHIDNFYPQVAILIACYNEEKVIAERLKNLFQLDYPAERFRVLVLNDGSQDSTYKVASETANSQNKIQIQILDFPYNQGKSPLLAKGVEWIKANWPDTEILAFTDANTIWAPESLSNLVKAFTDPEVGSVSGQLKYLVADSSPSGKMEGLYWKYEFLIKKLSSRLGNLPGAVGGMYAIRIELYKALSETQGDDFELPIMVILQGYKSIMREDAICWEPPSPSFGVEYRRKIRIVSRKLPSAIKLFNIALRRRKIIIAFELLSHKILRYSVPIYQIVLLMSSLLLWNYSVFYAWALVLQVIFYLFAATGYIIEKSGGKPSKPFQIPLYFTMVNLASLVSMYNIITKKPVVWARNR